MFDYFKPIPKLDLPQIDSYEIEEKEEPMVSLAGLGFEVMSVYYARLLPGTTFDAYVRETVARMLQKAQALLPDGYRFMILDAYRTVDVQKALWEEYRSIVAMENPDASAEEIDRRTEFYVSRPSYDEMKPALHNTGGAVDLTVMNDGGRVLDMGARFDDYRSTSATAYYEDSYNLIVKNNRRMLYNVMTEVGFTNHPSEWWHYDYGTKLWAYYTGKKPFYKGIPQYIPE